MLKKMMQRFGTGGAIVDAVLDDAVCVPGGEISGSIEIVGGDRPLEVEEVAVALSVVVEVEAAGGEQRAGVDLVRLPVTGAFDLGAKEKRRIPFRIAVPWEAPITHLGGHALHGVNVGVRTEVAIARAVDRSDVDAVAIEPLASQRMVLEVLTDLGFRFRRADVEHGVIRGVRQELPCYQEIELGPTPGSPYAGAVNELELTFVADPEGSEVILELDKRGGWGGSADHLGRMRVDHRHAEVDAVAAEIGGWLQRVIGARSSSSAFFGGPGAGYGAQYDGMASRSSFGSGDKGHRGGSGMGGVAAGVGAGLLGGLVMGEVFDEVGDLFDGDDGGGEGDEEF